MDEPRDEARQAWERGVETRLQELDDTLRAAALDPAPAMTGETVTGGLDDDEEFQPIFEHVGEWVEVYFAPTFVRRATQTMRWCPSWWDHPEAYIRLEALWRTWEVHRLDAQRGMAVWFRDFVDGQLLTLFSHSGPFEECSAQEHRERKPLPVTPAPDGWFTTGD